ncbi:MAG: FAD-binding oxidoreductase [Candidatus Nanopelagicales bacterium]
MSLGLDYDAAARAAAEHLRTSSGRVRLHKTTSNLFRSRTATESELDLSAFAGVFDVDPVGRTASVGGLTTYEDLVAATLPHGLVPLCVPQLRTITLGGAVTGLGIEAASFRNGCPHESVTAMDVLTGDGQVVRATADGEHRDLFFGFPNSYGSLGYALRLDIELEPVRRFVSLRHIRFGDAASLAAAMADVTATRQFDGLPVDYMDAVLFEPREMYLTLGSYSDLGQPSDYTGQQIYYRSVRERDTDVLTTHDYLWRWDTDWFWCSSAFGVQNPVVRRVWPDRYKRSDVYWKIIAADRRWRLSRRLDRMRGRAPKEIVVQDVEVPVAALPEFLDFFHREVGIAPVWLCPLRQRDPDRRWTLYEFDPATTYVNVGFWSRVTLDPGEDPDAGRVNQAIEAKVAQLRGRKSLYSTSYYGREEFYAIYGGEAYAGLKKVYDPDGRFPDLYDKTCVEAR